MDIKKVFKWFGVLCCLSVGVGMWLIVIDRFPDHGRLGTSLVVVPLMIIVTGAILFVLYSLIFKEGDIL